MNTIDIDLQPSETVITTARRVPVHFQRHGQIRAYRMHSDVALTSKRIVGSRSMMTKRQVTPDIDRSRITDVTVAKRLRMTGVSRQAFRGHFLRIEVADPDTTVAFLLDPEVAEEWAAELG